MRNRVFKSFQGKFKRLAIMALTLGLGATLLAANTPVNAKDAYSDIEQNIRTSMAVGNQIKALVEPSAGFAVIVVSAERKSNSPFQAVVSSKGNCILVVNEKPASWAAWAGFATDGRLSKTDSFYFAMLHELGHCVNKLSPGLESGVLPEGIESELYADVFALVAGSHLLDPQTYHQLAQGVIKARLAQERWFGGSSHATGSKLKAAYGLIEAEPGHNLDASSLGHLSRKLFEHVSGSRNALTASAVFTSTAIN